MTPDGFPADRELELRRLAFFAIRLLGLFLLIRGVEIVISTIATYQGFGFSPWTIAGHIFAAAVPVIAGLALFARTDWLAVRIVRDSVLTDAEIDSVLESDDEGGDPDPPDEVVSESPSAGAWTRIGLFLVGVGLSVHLVYGVVAYGVSVALYRELPVCRVPNIVPTGRVPFSSNPFANQSCSFWNTQTERDLIALCGYLAALGAAMFVVLRAKEIASWFERRKERSRVSGGEETDEEED